MIGNSLKSDILPVLACGGSAIHIPYEITWVHEMVDQTEIDNDHFVTVESIAEVPENIENLNRTCLPMARSGSMENV